MPRGDGTGPMGIGPMTGRGAGFCSGFASPGYGYGFGAGRGFRQMFYATGLHGWSRLCTQFNEKEFLKNQSKILENQLRDINRHLAEIEKSTEE